ncbi:MAG: hypothetical protein KAT53_02795 [Dehalococcoidia bacterium]|nr:hypothetical protein [Dehalococcoidia bacterium]
MERGGEGSISIEDRLREAQELAAKPIDLSEPEKERLTQIIELMKGSLDKVLEDALSKPRDEAFKTVSRYLIAMQGGGEVVGEVKSEIKPPAPIIHPKLEDIFAVLPEDICAGARRHLSCVKSYMKLEEEGEDGSQVLCPDCSPEKMIVCLRVEDPTIVDDLDEELRKAGVIR